MEKIQEFYVHVQSRMKYRKVSGNATTVTVRQAFSRHAEEKVLPWEQFHDEYKPLQKKHVENTGWN